MRSALALGELLIVFAVVGIALAICIPTLAKARDKQDKTLGAQKEVSQEKLPWINHESPAMNYVVVDQFTSPDGYRVLVFRYAHANINVVVLPPLSAVEAE